MKYKLEESDCILSAASTTCQNSQNERQTTVIGSHGVIVNSASTLTSSLSTSTSYSDFAPEAFRFPVETTQIQQRRELPDVQCDTSDAVMTGEDEDTVDCSSSILRMSSAEHLSSASSDPVTLAGSFHEQLLSDSLAESEYLPVPRVQQGTKDFSALPSSEEITTCTVLSAEGLLLPKLPTLVGSTDNSGTLTESDHYQTDARSFTEESVSNNCSPNEDISISSSNTNDSNGLSNSIIISGSNIMGSDLTYATGRMKPGAVAIKKEENSVAMSSAASLYNFGTRYTQTFTTTTAVIYLHNIPISDQYQKGRRSCRHINSAFCDSSCRSSSLFSNTSQTSATSQKNGGSNQSARYVRFGNLSVDNTFTLQSPNDDTRGDISSPCVSRLDHTHTRTALQSSTSVSSTITANNLFPSIKQRTKLTPAVKVTAVRETTSPSSTGDFTTTSPVFVTSSGVPKLVSVSLSNTVSNIPITCAITNSHKFTTEPSLVTPFTLKVPDSISFIPTFVKASSSKAAKSSRKGNISKLKKSFQPTTVADNSPKIDGKSTPFVPTVAIDSTVKVTELNQIASTVQENSIPLRTDLPKLTTFTPYDHTFVTDSTNKLTAFSQTSSTSKLNTSFPLTMAKASLSELTNTASFGPTSVGTGNNNLSISSQKCSTPKFSTSSSFAVVNAKPIKSEDGATSLVPTDVNININKLSKYAQKFSIANLSTSCPLTMVTNSPPEITSSVQTSTDHKINNSFQFNFSTYNFPKLNNNITTDKLITSASDSKPITTLSLSETEATSSKFLPAAVKESTKSEVLINPSQKCSIHQLTISSSPLIFATTNSPAAATLGPTYITQNTDLPITSADLSFVRDSTSTCCTAALEPSSNKLALSQSFSRISTSTTELFNVLVLGSPSAVPFSSCGLTSVASTTSFKSSETQTNSTTSPHIISSSATLPLRTSLPLSLKLADSSTVTTSSPVTCALASASTNFTNIVYGSSDNEITSIVPSLKSKLVNTAVTVTSPFAFETFNADSSSASPSSHRISGTAAAAVVGSGSFVTVSLSPVLFESSDTTASAGCGSYSTTASVPAFVTSAPCTLVFGSPSTTVTTTAMFASLTNAAASLSTPAVCGLPRTAILDYSPVISGSVTTAASVPSEVVFGLRNTEVSFTAPSLLKSSNKASLAQSRFVTGTAGADILVSQPVGGGLALNKLSSHVSSFSSSTTAVPPTFVFGSGHPSTSVPNSADISIFSPLYFRPPSTLPAFSSPVVLESPRTTASVLSANVFGLNNTSVSVVASASTAPSVSYYFSGSFNSEQTVPYSVAFGSTKTTAASVISPIVSGSTKATAALISSPIVSESTKATAASVISPFIFRSTMTTAASITSPFVCGSAKTIAASVTSSFVFGSTNTTVASVTSPFVFGSTETTVASVISPIVSGSTKFTAASVISPIVSGSTKTTTASISSPAVSGSTETTAASVILPFIFGSTKTTAASVISPTVSGSTKTTAASISLPIVSGSTETTTASVILPFIFGSTKTTAASVISPTVSGSTKTIAASVISPFIFGSTKTTAASIISPIVSGSTKTTDASISSPIVSGSTKTTDTSVISPFIIGSTTISNTFAALCSPANSVIAATPPFAFGSTDTAASRTFPITSVTTVFSSGSGSTFPSVPSSVVLGSSISAADSFVSGVSNTTASVNLPFVFRSANTAESVSSTTGFKLTATASSVTTAAPSVNPHFLFGSSCAASSVTSSFNFGSTSVATSVNSSFISGSSASTSSDISPFGVGSFSTAPFVFGSTTVTAPCVTRSSITATSVNSSFIVGSSYTSTSFTSPFATGPLCSTTSVPTPVLIVSSSSSTPVTSPFVLGSSNIATAATFPSITASINAGKSVTAVTDINVSSTEAKAGSSSSRLSNSITSFLHDDVSSSNSVTGIQNASRLEINNHTIGKANSEANQPNVESSASCMPSFMQVDDYEEQADWELDVNDPLERLMATSKDSEEMIQSDYKKNSTARQRAKRRIIQCKSSGKNKTFGKTKKLVSGIPATWNNYTAAATPQFLHSENKYYELDMLNEETEAPNQFASAVSIDFHRHMNWLLSSPQHCQKSKITPGELVKILSEFEMFSTSLDILQDSGRYNLEELINIIEKHQNTFKINGEVVSLRPEIKICAAHAGSAGCFAKDRCADLHICPKFVSNLCRDDDCLMGHFWKTNHNRKILETHFLNSLDELGLSKIYVTLASEISHKPDDLSICLDYNEEKCSKENCTALHFCIAFLVKLCSSDGHCRLNHSVYSMEVLSTLEYHGIAVNESPKDILLCISSCPLIKKEIDKFSAVANSPSSSQKDFEDNLVTSYDSSYNESSEKLRNIEKEKKILKTTWSHYFLGEVEVGEICYQSVESLCRSETTGCAKLHSNWHFHWQTREKGKPWVNLRDYQVIALEKAFCDPQVNTADLPPLDPSALEPTVRQLLVILHGRSKWQAKFDTMQLVLKNQNNQESTESLELRRLCTEESPNQPAPCIFSWYFLDKNKKWIEYGQVDSTGDTTLISNIKSEDIEKHFKKNANIPLTFQSSKFTYSLDTANQQQTNLQTNVARAIRRRPRPHLKKDEPDTALQSDLPDFWDKMQPDERVRSITLAKDSSEYQKIFSYYMQQGGNHNIIKIERVQNPFLYRAFQNKVQELTAVYKSKDVLDIQELFHGTRPEIIPKIVEENFDWRLHGTSVGHKYGRGTYFSSLPEFSYGYTQADSNGYRYMFIAQVAVGTITQGNSSMVRPPINPLTNLPYDSTVNTVANPAIFVKYDKQEYFPEYILTLT